MSTHPPGFEEPLDLLMGAPIGIFTSTASGRYLSANPAMARIYGYESSQALIDAVVDIGTNIYADPADRDELLRLLEEHGEVFDFETRRIRRDGSEIWVATSARAVRDASGTTLYYQGFVREITARKQAEKRQLFHARLLKILNRPTAWGDLLHDLLRELMDFAGFDAGGIRLREGDDFPYHAQIGLSPEFIRNENDLRCIENGVLRRDAKGRPMLKGTCGLVLSGGVELPHPFVTSGGSFWCNDTRLLRPHPGEEDSRHFPPNRCIDEGYRSLALIPLRSGEETIGLLQLNDRRSDRLNADLIHFFEDIGHSIGIAVKRMSTEKDLRESESRYRELFASNPHPMWVYDLETLAFLDVNGAAIAHYGYSREEFLGMTLMDIRPPEDVTRLLENIENVIEGYDQAGFWRHVTKDGTLIDVDIASHTLAFNGRRAELVLALDITERRQAETALAHERNLYRDLVASQPAGVYRLRVVGQKPCTENDWIEKVESSYTLEMVSDQFCRILDATRQECEANAAIVVHRIHPEDRADFTARNVQALETMERFTWEGRLEQAGKVRWVHFESVPRPLDNGDVIWTGILLEITEFKQAEQAMARAKEAAESASKAKSEFLANMSHELRTPLNGVMAMMQLLEMTPLDAEQTEYVHLAKQSSERLTRLLSDLLDISRIEAGKIEIRSEKFVVQELLRSVSELFSTSARDKGVSLDFSMDASVPQTLAGDEARLRQVLFNLVGNAVKFTEKGLVRLEMTTLAPLRDERCRILFVVSDTGIGIPEEKLPHLFTPFFQVEGSYTRKYQGAGLGLAIVRRLVDLMDGEISMDSELGEGTTVYVVVPMSRPAQAHGGKTLSRGREGADRPLAMRILLAEDDRSNALAASKLLEKEGHDVTVVENGRQALDVLESRDFDCILMDVQMPVLDGLEATGAIRSSDKKFADIPIIALTAYSMTGDREKFLAAGMSDYLSKPFRIEELRKVLERSVGKPGRNEGDS